MIIYFWNFCKESRQTYVGPNLVVLLTAKKKILKNRCLQFFFIDI